MNNINTKSIGMQDLIAECREQMASHGLEPDEELIIDGERHRYSVDEKKWKKDEWYVAYESSFNGRPSLTCIYGTWSGGDKHEFKSWENQSSASFSQEELGQHVLRLQQEKEKIKKMRRGVHDAAAKEAVRIWEGSIDMDPPYQYVSYLQAKVITAIGGRFGMNPQGHPSLIIPIKNIEGEIRSLQFISMNEAGKTYKTFLSGGEKKGNFFATDELVPGRHFYVTEGYATGMSVRMVIEQPTIIAFDVGNLDPVVKKIRAAFPHNDITIAGDSDKVGREKAERVAKKYGCNVVFPQFAEGLEYDVDGKKYTDFNDLQNVVSHEEVKVQLKNERVVCEALSEESSEKRRRPKDEDSCVGFDLSKLPPIVGDYVQSICVTTKAHPILVTTSVIVTAAAFIGKKRFISEKNYFQRLYPNVWMLSIAGSGQFKTTALNKGAKLAYEKSADVHGRIKELTKQIEEESSEIARKGLEEERLSVSQEDVLLPDKVTPEGFIELLADGHGGAMCHSEFGGWLKNFDKKYNVDLEPLLTHFYDVPPTYKHKTKTQGDYIIERPCFSICGVSTLTWVRERFGIRSVESGFAPRFLLFATPRNNEIPPALPARQNGSDNHAEERFKNVLYSLNEAFNYTFSSAAKVELERIHRRVIYNFADSLDDVQRELFEPFIKRWSASLIKVAMIMQVFIDSITREISREAIISASIIIECAIKATYQLFSEELGESHHQRQCRAVLKWMEGRLSKESALSRSALIASKVLKGGSKAYDEVVDTLVQSKKVEVVNEEEKRRDWRYVLINTES